MALPRTDGDDGSDPYGHIKQFCGHRIEQERRLRGLSQLQLGRRAGISRDWIRQLESGYPKVRLDDHCACLSAINLSPLILFVPLLFEMRGIEYSSHFLSGDLAELERELFDAVLNWNVKQLYKLMGDPDASMRRR